MLPIPSASDVIYGGNGDSVICCDDPCRSAVSPYADHLALCKFHHWMSLACGGSAESDGVVHVVSARAPVKVFRAIVGFVSVLVARLKPLWARSNKGTRNKPMDVLIFLPPILGELYSEVSGRANVRLYDLPMKRPSAAIRISDLPRFGSNPSKVRNLVYAFIARNWHPYFIHRMIVTSEARLINVELLA